MLSALCASATMLRQSFPVKWYGPATATFRTQFAGNPYDFTENDVHVRFSDNRGHAEDRLAYFNEVLGSWQAELVTRKAGTYSAQLIRNGMAVPGKNREGTLRLTRPLLHGYLHPDKGHPNRFVWDDGTVAAPIGFDLGWQDPKLLPITAQIAKMGKSGVDWTRIWACAWDGKNPWWPNTGEKLPPEHLWAPALQKWDAIREAAESSGVNLQFVLFHHGEFSSQVDPNWPDNPWNVKNGGFLSKPGDFFTNEEAKKRAKIWLRYAVARYGASPSVFGWELFNEVQWVDPIHIDHRWTEVETWHKEMADYVRSIDPYHHPVTSSSELRPGFDSSLDYVQPHTYPNNIVSAIMSSSMPQDKPGFFGEFGPGGGTSPSRLALRDGLYSGLLANHAASGMFWYWDAVERQNLYSEFAVARKVAELSSWRKHSDAKTCDVRVSTPTKSLYIFQPGLGWANSTQASFDLPSGATAQALGKVSSFLQGKAHPEMSAGPLKLKFQVERPSTVTIYLGQIADSGGAMTVTLDANPVYAQSFSKADHPSPVILPVSAGSHVVRISNEGADWITLQRVSITNLGEGARIEALGDRTWALLRSRRLDNVSGPLEESFSGLSLSDGQYRLVEVDLNSGSELTSQVAVSGGSLRLGVRNNDEALIFIRI